MSLLPPQPGALLRSPHRPQVARLKREEPSNPAGTAALAAAIDREITDQAPWVPLFTPRLADLTSACVLNYEDNSGAVLLDQLWVR